MNNQFTQEELKNILLLANRANITGNEASVVSLLIQKINGLILSKEAPKLEKTKDSEEKK